MASSFEELDQFLCEEFSDDGWLDYGITVAIEIIRTLSVPDLIKLNQVWEMRNQIWQERCAQIVTDATNVNYALEILIGMIERADQRIAIMINTTQQNYATRKQPKIHQLSHNKTR